MNEAPGTMAFLLRWHFVQLVAGLGIAAFAGYQLLTYEPPKPAALDAAFSSPAVDFFVPLMWVALVVGLVMAGGAWFAARRGAHGR